MVGAFSSFDQGHGDAFLNGLRTDADARRKGVATALIKGIDADLAARGYKSIRFATTSHNEPMIALTNKLGLNFRPHKMCRCGARSERPMRATRLKPSADELPAAVASLWAFVQTSDQYKLSGGMMHSRTIQFAACAPPTIEALVKAGGAYILGPLSAPTALALVTPSETGPNSILSFAAGPAVDELLDDLCTLIPPGGEIWAYWPVGSAAYELAIAQTRLPSGARFYCPRDTEQLVTEWEAGSLQGGA